MAAAHRRAPLGPAILAPPLLFPLSLENPRGEVDLLSPFPYRRSGRRARAWPLPSFGHCGAPPLEPSLRPRLG